MFAASVYKHDLMIQARYPPDLQLLQTVHGESHVSSFVPDSLKPATDLAACQSLTVSNVSNPVVLFVPCAMRVRPLAFSFKPSLCQCRNE